MASEKWGPHPDYSAEDVAAEQMLLDEVLADLPSPVRAGLPEVDASRLRDDLGAGGPARWSDSAESWDGAPSVQEKHRVRLWVLGALRLHGPISDDALLDLALREGVVKTATSSVRSRRNDLSREGLVVCVDKSAKTRSGKRAARWALTQP